MNDQPDLFPWKVIDMARRSTVPAGIRAVDLFAWCGGSSEGMRQAGINVVLAANHSPIAVDSHRRNHPETLHWTQDLQQADFAQAPEHDLLWGSPSTIAHRARVVTVPSGRSSDRAVPVP